MGRERAEVAVPGGRRYLLHLPPDLDGRKLWSGFAEPPWTYAVAGDEVTLDVMGEVTRFGLREGPPAGQRWAR